MSILQDFQKAIFPIAWG